MKSCRMKCFFTPLVFLCVLCASVVQSLALDREAFTFTNYDLNVQIEPEQHRLGVRGKITLRNDSPTPQKNAVLQISSSLDWRAIKIDDKTVQFITQTYTSDIDHTGALSEAVVTLPQPVVPHGTVEIEIAYEGVVILDATRLTRIGTPEETAQSTDWDQISTNFTAVRGAGYVAWYPIATEAANLSEGDELSEVLERWKAREAGSQMSLLFESTKRSTILFSGTPDGFVVVPTDGIVRVGAFSMIRPGANVPTFVLADYKNIEVKNLFTINFLPGKEAVAKSYAEILGTLDPLSAASRSASLQIAQLPDSGAAPFASQRLLLLPMRPATEEDRRTLVYAVAREKVPSQRVWIGEGLAHFAQVLDIEQQHGRKAALEYLSAHRSFIVESEKGLSSAKPRSSVENETAAANCSLINATDEMYLQSKAMWVWWMLRDMVGDFGVNMTLAQYSESKDTDASYMPRLIASHTQRDLEWFFDDWVYRDRGLPDFKVESVFPRKTMTDSYIVTVTVDNLGTAGAEVPVIVKFAGGEVVKRLEVRAKSKATIRVETPSAPQEIVVNDGSVPESDMTNNIFKMEATATN
jgi:hypothetical protein